MRCCVFTVNWKTLKGENAIYNVFIFYLHRGAALFIPSFYNIFYNTFTFVDCKSIRTVVHPVIYISNSYFQRNSSSTFANYVKKGPQQNKNVKNKVKLIFLNWNNSSFLWCALRQPSNFRWKRIRHTQTSYTTTTTTLLLKKKKRPFIPQGSKVATQRERVRELTWARTKIVSIRAHNVISQQKKRTQNETLFSNSFSKNKKKNKRNVHHTRHISAWYRLNFHWWHFLLFSHIIYSLKCNKCAVKKKSGAMLRDGHVAPGCGGGLFFSPNKTWRIARVYTASL